MSTSDSCNVGTSKSNDDGVCEVNNMLHNMSTDDADVVVSVCANCGKEGSDINNVCNKCKQVRYCNAACKKKHRHKHKKDCEEHQRLAAEQAAKLHDEELFKQPPAQDCPICFQRMPSIPTGSRNKSCCGKEICSGCIHAVNVRDGGVGLCPFCRDQCPTSDEDIIERIKKRIDAGDAEAIYLLAGIYDRGMHGLPQDHTKAFDLYQRAVES